MCYWVGKASLRSWKRLAMEQIEIAQKEANSSTGDLIASKGNYVLQNCCFGKLETYAKTHLIW